MIQLLIGYAVCGLLWTFWNVITTIDQCAKHREAFGFIPRINWPSFVVGLILGGIAWLPCLILFYAHRGFRRFVIKETERTFGPIDP
jgi:4-amino-4-deoxy-L-arabinose transferase-like glycosyltransferase